MQFIKKVFRQKNFTSLIVRILKIFHIKAFEEEVVTEEELISTVTEAQESGVLEAEEAEMIHNIFEFLYLLFLNIHSIDIEFE